MGLRSHVKSLFRKRDTAVEPPAEPAPHAIASLIRERCASMAALRPHNQWLLPRGFYTQLAHELGTTPTYVSIVAGKAGYMVATKAILEGAA